MYGHFDGSPPPKKKKTEQIVWVGNSWGTPVSPKGTFEEKTSIWSIYCDLTRPGPQKKSPYFREIQDGEYHNLASI